MKTTPAALPAVSARAVKAALRAESNRGVAEFYEKYFKHTLPFLGIKSPQLNSLMRPFCKCAKAAPAEAVVEQALLLCEEKHFEERSAGLMLLNAVVHKLDDSFMTQFEPVFDRSCVNWGICDSCCSLVLRELVKQHASTRKRMVRWSQHQNTWRQRASAVAFLSLISEVEHHETIEKIATHILSTDDRFAQLGMGWLWRYMVLSDQERFLNFLRVNYFRINREALRYALEKVPGPLRQRIMKGDF